MGRGVRIAGWGKYVPERVLTNHDLARLVDTSDEWIVTRTGIRERHIAAPHEGTASMALAAAQRALDRAGARGADVQLIIVATVTPDYQFPAVACLLQAALDARAGAMDLQAGCSGFVYALVTAVQFLRGGLYDRVLVIGAETLSRILDWTDRSTCVLFGDGAGAVYLEAADEQGGEDCILACELGAEGANPGALYMHGAARPPAAAPPGGTLPTVDGEARYVTMDGQEVFRFATQIMGRTVERVARDAGWRLEEVDLIIPHQANLRIIQAAARSLGLPLARFYVNLDRYGNTSSASVPLALNEAIEEGRLRPGHRVVLAAFGAGLTWAATAMRWGDGDAERAGARAG